MFVMLSFSLKITPVPTIVCDQSRPNLVRRTEGLDVVDDVLLRNSKGIRGDIASSSLTESTQVRQQGRLIHDALDGRWCRSTSTFEVSTCARIKSDFEHLKLGWQKDVKFSRSTCSLFLLPYAIAVFFQYPAESIAEKCSCYDCEFPCFTQR